MRTFLKLSVALVLLSTAACGDDEAMFSMHPRVEAEQEDSCFDVCTDRLGLDDAHPIDDCAEITDEAGAPHVACMLASGDFWIENTRRFETIVVDAEVDSFDCYDVCGEAIKYHQSDELVDCANVITPEGDAAALCAMQWHTPRSAVL